MSAPDLEEDETAPLRMDRRLWRRVAGIAWRHKRCMVPMVAASGVLAIADGLLNLVVKDVVNTVTAGGTAAPLWPHALQYAITGGVLVLCVFLLIYYAGQTATHVAHDLRRDLFAKLQELPFSYYDRKSVGWLMSRVTSDCSRIGDFLAWGAVDIVWGFTLIGVISTVLLWLDWQLALVVLTVVPVLALVTLRFKALILASARRIRKMNALLTASFNEGINGARTTKTLAREDAAATEFGAQARGMHSASMSNALQTALYQPVIALLGGTGLALALWYGGGRALAGSLSLGELVAFFAYTVQLFAPIQEMANVFGLMQRAQASSERIFALLDSEPEIRDSEAVQARLEAVAAAGGPQPGQAEDGLPARIGSIEFRNVTFRYRNGPVVLRDFNLTVRAGESIALVGPTGGGKSTIVALLCRFYEPVSGQILIDGVEYRERGLRVLQSRLGMVLQTPHLFTGTVRENIRYGRLNATDAEVEAAARRVNAHGFIAALPQGYESAVGEGGGRLSTGQKQLIALARATLADPQIFVMDEATSSVDTETEHLIQRGLDGLLQGRISFVIAHRLSTIRNASRILVIEDGGIREAGTHHELLLQRGHYYSLYTSQFVREHEEDVLNAAGE